MAALSREAVVPRGTVLFLLLAACNSDPAALGQTPRALPSPADLDRGTTEARAPSGGSDATPLAGDRDSTPIASDAPTLWTSEPEPAPQTVWGIVGLRGYPYGEHVASNGVEFKQLFSFDLDFNLMLWRQQGLYFFAESRFWGQKAAPGITNPTQGVFDFSKREFDITPGLAWNYWGFLEARVFAYSYNNLNRGDSTIAPSGFNDGVGIENRYYLGDTYADLGTSAFDKARASFLSVGFYPSKTMVDGNGVPFDPGPFARAYLILDLFGEQCYLYGDVQFLATRAFRPKLFTVDAGIAIRPFAAVPRLEFRVGSEDTFDLDGNDSESSVYLSVRYVY
jgi:hypothetical protein